jgi:cytochrome c553
MSYSYGDEFEVGVVSGCCGANVYLTDMCAECHEHTDVETVEEDEPSIMTMVSQTLAERAKVQYAGWKSV